MSTAGVDIPVETVIVHVPGLTSSRSPANDSHGSEGNNIIPKWIYYLIEKYSMTTWNGWLRTKLTNQNVHFNVERCKQ